MRSCVVARRFVGYGLNCRTNQLDRVVESVKWHEDIEREAERSGLRASKGAGWEERSWIGGAVEEDEG